MGFVSLLIASMTVATTLQNVESAESPVLYEAKIVATYPHDHNAFTQGLFFANGRLYESTGQYGASELRQVNIKSGFSLLTRKLPDEVFGEGSTAVDGKLINVTWRAGRGFVHTLDTLEPEDEFSYEGEGWGLTYDGEKLILSDGSSTLRFLDPETFEETSKLDVTLHGGPVEALNELEWVEGEIFANVWQTDWIVRIDPASGNVTGLIDLSKLHPAARRKNVNDDVANGIAYEPVSKRLFVTGKNWPSLFEIEIENLSK